MKTLRKTLFIAALFLTAVACGKKESPAPQNTENNNPVPVIDNCGTDNPVEKLAWIGELRLKSYPQPRMYAYIHENKTIFAFSECADCNDEKVKIFNCKGETLAEGKAKCDEILQKANSQKLLFDGNLTDCDRVENPAKEVSYLAWIIKESETDAAITGKSDLIIYSCLYRGRRIYGVGIMYNGKYAPDYIYSFWDCNSNCLAHIAPVRPDDTFNNIFSESSHFELIYIYKP